MHSVYSIANLNLRKNNRFKNRCRNNINSQLCTKPVNKVPTKANPSEIMLLANSGETQEAERMTKVIAL